MHFWDHTTPVPEVMSALDDVVRSGKALHEALVNGLLSGGTAASITGWEHP
ncbi:uncharacterized protein SOCE26_010740 [Sorangium cellulosum]|uniref:Uncharacterized protein n=1 Tax=Sorangium cellulosum TaxID=56 RepID=A0A2L0EK73_SORCE|nr:uncharacterized protein SOCE26_010740 [Sorangium cellulosum]